MKNPRLLTKSRFKLALDCPTKLYYTRKSEYENQSNTDSFLEGLAQGGFQVEELARMEHPNGIAITGDDYNYQIVVNRTLELLKQENVTIFEPAFLIDGLFIRVDILVKKGNRIQLLEVKAKSISSNSHNSFINSKGNLGGGWNSYLYDIAFQKYVMQLCYPEWEITSSLKLVDKDATTSVDGLHTCFKIVSSSDLRTGISKKEGLKREDLGDSILCTINVDEEIDLILSQNPTDETRSFPELMNYFRKHYQSDTKIFTEIGSHCRGCEFKQDNPTTEEKSGFHECWTSQLQLSVSEINQPKVYDVWFNPAKKVLEEGRFFMHELSENDLNIRPEAGKISRSERQWLQIEKTINKDQSPHFDLDNLREELASWQFPLNFIDFETTAVAIPFMTGMHPYEQLAFQFSHHIVFEDGRVEHYNEYLNTGIGVFPNFDFIRALKDSLSINDGSIFRYHNHENTIVNVIYDQLRNSNEADKQELLDFIETISHNTGKYAKVWCGERDMIDLQKTVVNYYYDPITNGSNSIKAILPAVLYSSDYLQEKYQQQLANLNLTSKNFEASHVFLTMENGVPISPYKALPPIFEGWDNEQLEQIADSLSEINDGGAALFAYGKLQFPDVKQEEREAIRNGLLRYCELDTLAMVMIYEYFREVCK
ncbi:DUF2779 domain-containing protein [Gillisia sp. Hel_I_29]|uniref:DUF2779 domain-containing protein n=1 Tax=Gillisia sp. Hel_I_29 TaxID=1249975 RepID=UPI0005586835|nr:DUF2779 domain-containing protein [Gillisia sp. Hel_I_29]